MLRQLRNTAIKTIGTGVVVVGAVEVTTHLPSEGRSSKLYHYLSDDVAMPIIRRVLNPEDAHNLAIEVAKYSLTPRFHPSSVESFSVNLSSEPFKTSSTKMTKTTDDESSSDKKKSKKRNSLVFPNCIGLAAGFDKDGVVIKQMMSLGFGFVEIGSVTPEPQPGNPKPRMFRLYEDRGVINRYGFNSVGLDEVEANVKAFREIGMKKVTATVEEDWIHFLGQKIREYALPLLWAQDHAVAQQGILGINLGKNKLSTEETADYEKGIAQLGPYADYLVVNISSPNTPGLRALQKREPIRRLLKAAIHARDNIPPHMRGGLRGGIVEGKDIPLLVKIAPDLSIDDMEDIAAAVIESGVDGIVISNTSNQRPDNLLSKNCGETGGLSGAPIKDISTKCIRDMYRLTDGQIPIIGVGGVGSGHDAYEKLKAGASLVQIYSMLVYEGPGLVSKIRKELAEIMLQNGHRKVEDVVGIDHEDINWKKREARIQNERLLETAIVDE